jgi:hypothetical protein
MERCTHYFLREQCPSYVVSDAHTIRYITSRYNITRYITTRYISTRYITIRYYNISLLTQFATDTIRY